MCSICAKRLGGIRAWKSRSPEAQAAAVERARKTMTAFHDSKTPEERIAQGKAARSCVAHSHEAVVKQWETVKADPEKFAKAKSRLSRTSKNFWNSLTPESRIVHIQKIFANITGRSKAGDQFIEHFAKEGVILEVEQGVHGFIVDGLDSKKKVVVEFYGDMFHCRPNNFPDPNQYCSWISRTVAQQWDRDLKRLGVFYRYGYLVVIVWETDWYSDPHTQIRRIKDALQSRKDQTSS